MSKFIDKLVFELLDNTNALVQTNIVTVLICNTACNSNAGT